MEKENTFEIVQRQMEEYSKDYVGPIMTEYVEWILNQALNKGFKKLYFLARDGYLLSKIAKIICQEKGLDIECRYLYVSRIALRVPTFHLLGDKFFDVLFLKSNEMTYKNIMLRTGLSSSKIGETLSELGIRDCDKILSNEEIEKFKRSLKESKTFMKNVVENSKKAYQMTIDYFKQEGVFDDENVVIVDSGWVGSIQQSFNTLIRSAGYNGKLTGFYFGLVKKTAKENGEFLTYYFERRGGYSRKVNFNNNVFECMLSANHGMTTGYENKDGKIQPVLQNNYSEEMSKLIECQINGACNYVSKIAKDIDIKNFDKKSSLKKTEKLIKRCMVNPTLDEIEMFSYFLFCDDCNEGYHHSLTDKSLVEHLKEITFFSKLKRKLLRKKSDIDNSFWTYAIIKQSPNYQGWYRFNYKLARFFSCLLGR